MKTHDILTLAVSAPILIAIFWAILGLDIQPKKVPVKVRKNENR